VEIGSNAFIFCLSSENKGFIIQEKERKIIIARLACTAFEYAESQRGTFFVIITMIKASAKINAVEIRAY